jgi:DNA replication protein DnaC
MYIDAPHTDPIYAAIGATQMQPCPVCNAAELPSCNLCGDVGWVRLEVPLSHPQFGRPVRCPNNCATVQQQTAARADRARRLSRLPTDYQNCTFAAFDTYLDEETQVGKLNARRAAGMFVDAADSNFFIDAGSFVGSDLHGEMRNWLIFTGPHGRGKTGMACSIVNALSASGRSVLYIRLQDFFTAVQRRYREDWEAHGDRDDFDKLSSSAVVDEVKSAPVLIIDEWFITEGRPTETANKRDLLENLMRYRSAERLPTIITTNHTIDKLEDAWGTTAVSVVRARSFVIPMTGLALRPDAIHIPA